MLVISDTTAITNLHQIKLLLIIRDLFGKVIIPIGVYEELSVIAEQKQIIDESDWIIIKAIDDRSIYESLLNEIDKGEAEAITLAIEMKSDLLIMDEIKGRRVAISYGLNIIGLLGILVQAKRKKLIPVLRPYLEALVNEANFRVGKNLYAKVLKSVGE